ncbi:MAG: peptidoglycan DD-metalloendopeptidase family protein [Hyphomicrobiales bacterium]|nr:peptidoglycan DD-metalloendopeptidase family protein [Hyphomicrobiales bacterium]
MFAAALLVGLGPLAAAPPEGLRSSTAPATPNEGADRRAALRAELDGVLRDIDLGKERQTAIAAEIETLTRDRGRLAEQLVATGNRLRQAEARLEVTEKRIADLDRDVAHTRAALEARRGVLAEILAALQRIGRSPPPALMVRPSDALASVRSAILIGAVLPELRDQAEALLSDLQTLQGLETAAAGERDRFRAEAEDLVAERKRLELLVAERRRTTGEREASLAEERRRAGDLAARAGSLRDLLAALDKAVPAPAPSGRGAPFALAEARGRLPLPVAGETILRFGEADAAGLPSRGLSIASRPGATITSPCDGAVIFAGPFRSYGRLLIINGGDGYHVVLAGMERIDVEIGQTVLAGEPVGFMGSGPAATDGPERSDRPVLYVEFRKDGTSIDPSPWWARARDEKVRG